MRKLQIFVLFILASLAAVTVGVRAEPVILTVTGEIGKTNRGPFDAFHDILFDSLGIEFTGAYAFTRADLLALPQAKLTVRYDNWPAEVSVTGPLLKDVLATVEARGDTILVRALDGYAPEFQRSDVEAGEYVLALEADGAPLALGGRGPVWLVFPPAEGGAESDDGLTWAAFHIEVQ